MKFEGLGIRDDVRNAFAMASHLVHIPAGNPMVPVPKVLSDRLKQADVVVFKMLKSGMKEPSIGWQSLQVGLRVASIWGCPLNAARALLASGATFPEQLSALFESRGEANAVVEGRLAVVATAPPGAGAWSARGYFYDLEQALELAFGLPPACVFMKDAPGPCAVIGLDRRVGVYRPGGGGVAALADEQMIRVAVDRFNAPERMARASAVGIDIWGYPPTLKMVLDLMLGSEVSPPRAILARDLLVPDAMSGFTLDLVNGAISAHEGVWPAEAISFLVDVRSMALAHKEGAGGGYRDRM